MRLTVEPYLATLSQDGNNLVEGWQETPGRKHFFVASIHKSLLADYGAFEYFNDDSRQWWTGGMGKWLSGDVYLLCDNPDDGIFIFYHYLTVMQFLGRLNNDTKLYRAAMKAFKKLAKEARHESKQ